jgi:hypothetical protein
MLICQQRKPLMNGDSKKINFLGSKICVVTVGKSSECFVCQPKRSKKVLLLGNIILNF